MRRFAGLLQVTVNRETMILRLRRRAGGVSKLIIGPQFLQKRAYSHQQPGAYPPPPPPDAYAREAPYYSYNNGPYYAPPGPPGHFPQPPPLSALSGDVGTKERPLVVVTASAKSTWVEKLWLLVMIGICANFFFFVGELLLSASSMDMSKRKGGDIVRNGFPSMMSSHEISTVNLDTLDVTFDSIRGCDEAKKELEEIVEFLKDPEKFHALGGRLPRGALLVGPPGCGKTLLAKAIAKEAGVNFFYATGSEFDEMFVGVGSRRIRELFAAAKEHSPALIFIDEIDALGSQRSRSDHAFSRMTLNQLLAEMDGFQSKDSVIVLAATNTPETLDKALTRPGRLDTTIAVDPPDMKGRAEVLQIYLDKIKTDESVNAMQIARGTTGFTGAELNNLVNLAAIRAAILNKSMVGEEEMEYAKDRVMMGAESRKVIPEEERRVTAYHEGAHALSAILLKDEGAEPVHKATIVPRGNGIMGLVQQQPERDRYSQSKKQCLARLKVCVAGRVGEEILLGADNVTTGAASDFRQATSMARQMVRRFGFSNSLGFVDYESADTAEGAYISEETKKLIETEVRLLVNKAYEETKALLLTHHDKLDLIANSLLKYETLNGDDLNKILKGEVLPARLPAASTQKSTPPTPSGGSGGSSGEGHGKRRAVPVSS